MTNRFEHLRHKPPSELVRPRELVLACPPLRSHINLSRLVRTAGCCGITRVIACGNAKVTARIARDGADSVSLEVHRTLPPALKKLKTEGFELVAIEQTTNSESMFTISFTRKTALILGEERAGLDDEVLSLVDRVTEIPVWGLPFSHNVATAGAMAMYEYCRQFPEG